MSHRGLVIMCTDLCADKGMSCVLEIHKCWRSPCYFKWGPVTELRTVNTDLSVSSAKFGWLVGSWCTVIADEMQPWISDLHFHHFSHVCIIPGSDRHLQRHHMDYITGSESIILFAAIHMFRCSPLEPHFADDMPKILY